MFERLRNLFRRKPGPIGPPPSSRQVPLDPGLHAVDFSHRYADAIDYHIGNRMMELGIPTDRIGWGDALRGIRHAAFHPHGTSGGNISPDGRIILDSGIFNADLLKAGYGERVSELVAKAPLRDRIDLFVAHEFEEHRNGMSHVEALKAVPGTRLPIGDRARKLGAAMEKGWKGR